MTMVDNAESYIRGYALYDYDMELRKCNYITSKGLQKYEKYYDPLTGAILVPDYLWNSATDNVYKDIYCACAEREKYQYVLPANDGIVLRGASTYYYLLAHKGMYEKVNIHHITEWLANYKIFFDSVFQYEFVINNELDKFCIMGFLDNIRNYLINAINLYIYCVVGTKCYDSMLVQEKDNADLHQIIYALRVVYINWEQLMFSSELNLRVGDDLGAYIRDVEKILDRALSENEDVNYDLAFRSYRELDSFYELYVTSCQYIENIQTESLVVGILQGGLEIPIVLSTFAPDCCKDIGFLHLYGSFKDRHLDNKVTNLKVHFGELLPECILCDENILTGNTLLIASELLSGIGCKVVDYLVVRRIGTNRLYHVLSYEECIDIAYCRNNIKGMLFKTHYTKVKKNTNIKGMYYNELFQFDLSKECVYELLFINGVYSPNSRIACFRNLERALNEKIRE